MWAKERGHLPLHGEIVDLLSLGKLEKEASQWGNGMLGAA
jgi:hypothetical protein